MLGQDAPANRKAFQSFPRNPRMKPTLLLLALTPSLFAAERPEVTVLLQTKWEETLTITVDTRK